MCFGGVDFVVPFGVARGQRVVGVDNDELDFHFFWDYAFYVDCAALTDGDVFL